MRSQFIVLLLCLSSFHWAFADEIPGSIPEDVGMSSKQLAQVGSILKSAIDRKQTAGAVVVVARKGKVVLTESVGKLSLENEMAMRPDALFRIYSMTKPITSVAAMILVEEGKLALDVPVSQILPELSDLRIYRSKKSEPVPSKNEMTIRDLLRHTSGFTYGADGGAVDKLYAENQIESSDDDLATLVSKLSKLPLVYEPGTRFHYSVSTDVLGRVIEVASGMRLDEFLNTRIFVPLQMIDTGFGVPDDKLDRFSTSYWNTKKQPWKPNDTPSTSRFRTPRRFLSGGGGLISTARDYLRFCQMLLNEGELDGVRILKAGSVREMVTNQLPPKALPMSIGGFPQPGLGFGLGVSVQLENAPVHSPLQVGEYGWSGSASTFFWVSPRAELIVIILQQVEPISLNLSLSLKPAIYAAIND